MNSTLKRLPDGTIEISLTIPWPDISKIYNTVIGEYVKNAEVDGFRKGKAPRSVVEPSLNKTKVYEEVLKRLIPDLYTSVVKSENIHPITMPKVDLEKAQEGKDWSIKIATCEKPSITFDNYKEKIQQLKAGKTKKIWVPGQTNQKEEDEKLKKPSLDEILNILFQSTHITIPRMLIEEEVNRSLSDLVDQTRKLGLSVEQYLTSSHKTADSVRKEYEQQAQRTITLELALEALADKENIFVSDDDIAKAIQSAKSDDERKALEKEKYYLATILRRQKTLDFLSSLY